MRDRALRRKPADAVQVRSDDHKQEDRDRMLPAAE
jgi:hypothetical protein